MTKRPVVIVGAGGHAKVVIDVLQLLDYDILCATDIEPSLHGTKILGVPVTGDDKEVAAHSPQDVILANGVGAIASVSQRQAVFEKFSSHGYEFVSLIHPTAFVSKSAAIDSGVTCMAGTVIQPDVRIEENSVINTRASIDHDSQIGPHCFIGPGVVTGGNVVIKSKAFIGTGAVILPSIIIGENTVIGAGAVVTKNVNDGEKVVGNPARPIGKE